MRLSLSFFAVLLGGVSAAVPQSSAPFADAITVTATATPEEVADVPASVDVVSAEEIFDHKAAQAIDLLRTLPGLELVQAGSRGKAASLFTRGTNSSHTLVLWNGIELNDPYLGGFDWSTLATDGVERVEVVRGPFSALYGSSAVGGVVQLVTRRGGSPGGQVGQVRLEAGSREYARAGGTAGGTLGALAVDLSGHLRRGQGEVENDFYDGEEIDLGVDGTFGGTLGDAARLGALVRWGKSVLGVPFDYAGVSTPHRRQTFATTSIAVPFSWSSAAWHLDAQAARTATDLTFRDADDPFASSAADAQREQARFVLRRSVGEHLEATGGGDWDRQQVETGDAFGPGIDERHQRTWAAFGQASWSSGPWRVDAGVRRDDNDAFGAATSLKAGAAWALAERWRLRASYGEAFRAPSLADLYYPGFSNPDLLPERSQSYEVAVDGGSGPWRASLALFENDLDNLIEFDFVTFVPQNLGRARARGIEGSLAGSFGGWNARLVATWLDAENRDSGERLLRRPDESASLVVVAHPGALTLSGVLRYVGDRTDFGDLALDAYSTVDLTLAWRIAGRWEPFVRAENVFDASYEEAAGYPAPGLAFRAGFDLSF